MHFTPRSETRRLSTSWTVAGCYKGFRQWTKGQFSVNSKRVVCWLVLRSARRDDLMARYQLNGCTETLFDVLLIIAISCLFRSSHYSHPRLPTDAKTSSLTSAENSNSAGAF